ncbi:MAG: SH3 domain-containing protein [Chloroflexota bacterium]
MVRFIPRKAIVLMALVSSLLFGCRGGAAEPTTASLTIPPPAEPSATPTQVAELEAEATLPPPAVTTLPTNTATAAPTQTATLIPSPSPTVRPTTYNVIYVTADDVLNVRTGPGADNEVAGELPPDAQGIEITGPGQTVEGHVWTPITAGSLSGWVNSFYLTEAITGGEFCQDGDVATLVEALLAAVVNRDGEALAGLVHPQRGLRVQTYWWNPTVFFSGDQLAGLFTSNESYYWGIEDGSGFDINGSFSQVILPMLDKDLLPATEWGCNEFLHGNTTGYVQLPDGYQAANFYTLYRQSGEIEFDWGTWAVGVEYWQGQYYISFLIHYDYEI